MYKILNKYTDDDGNVLISDIEISDMKLLIYMNQIIMTPLFTLCLQNNFRVVNMTT